jgi:ribonuclease T1
MVSPELLSWFEQQPLRAGVTVVAGVLMKRQSRRRRTRPGANRSTLATGIGILLLLLVALFGRGQVADILGDQGPVGQQQPGGAGAMRDAAPDDDGFAVVSADQLPPEARTTLALIERGGPFPYRQDGSVFQNRERLLPRRETGYYREYTVETPGASNRGARRIVAGAEGELFYTDDHYDSFVKVDNP